MYLYSKLFSCQFFLPCLLIDGNIHRNIVRGVDPKHLQQCIDLVSAKIIINKRIKAQKH